MAVEIQILSVLQNGKTGHYSIHMRTVESTPDGEKVGVEHVEGIDALALEKLYGDVDIDTAVTMWLENRVKPSMLSKHTTHGKVSTVLGGLVGKRLPLA